MGVRTRMMTLTKSPQSHPTAARSAPATASSPRLAGPVQAAQETMIRAGTPNR